MYRPSVFVLALMSGTVTADPPSPEHIAALADPDRAILKRNKVEPTTESLIAVVRQACGQDVKSGEIAAEVAKLGNNRYAVREQATKRLLEIGPVAVLFLRRAMSSADAELAKRAREIADKIVEKNSSEVLPAAVHVLLRQREKSAVEALIQLLAFVHDPELEADIWYGLDGIAGKDTAMADIIGKHVSDDSPARRAMAAHFAARYGGRDGKAKAARLLADPEPLVRLRAAQGLTAADDGRGIPALIDLLIADEPAIRWQASDLLRRVGNPGPAVPELTANRKDCGSIRPHGWHGGRNQRVRSTWPSGPSGRPAPASA